MAIKSVFEINSQDELEKMISDCIENYSMKLILSLKSDQDPLMTSYELCQYLKISRGKLWQLTSKGIIPSIFVGNSRRFQKKEVLKALNINHKTL